MRTLELERISAGQAATVTGRLIGFADGVIPLVVYPGQTGTAARRARTACDLHRDHIGQAVLLTFDGGDPDRPIVIGRIRAEQAQPPAARPGSIDVDVDGARLTISAAEEVVLRCGRASITLTKAGKIIIDGKYIVSRSTGVNRIKGGSVQLN